MFQNNGIYCPIHISIAVADTFFDGIKTIQQEDFKTN